MPAQSQKQQKAAGAALAAKRNPSLKKKLRGASQEMFNSMTEAELEKLAATSRTGLPIKKSS